MDLALKGKVALVTGASQGIGAATVRMLAEAGADVVVHHRNEKSKPDADKLCEEVVRTGADATTVSGDVTNPSEVDALASTAGNWKGRIDVLVNNAGALGGRYPLEEIGAEGFSAVLDLNARSALLVSRAVVPFMAEGSIVNTSSLAAATGGGPGATLYAGAKAFVEGASRTLAKELGPRIRVNTVSPGPVYTAFHTDRSRLDALAPSIPLQRVGAPEDIAGAILFLASDRLSGWMTGQVIAVNGGLDMS